MVLNGKETKFKFNGEFIKTYDENRNMRYILEVDVKYPKYLHDLHSDGQCLPEIMKISKCNKLVLNLYNKKLCCSHNSFKISIKSWISTKNVYRVMQFNQKSWFKKYIDLNTIWRNEAKNDFEKNQFASLRP